MINLFIIIDNMENLISREFLVPCIFGGIIILILLIRYLRKRRLKKLKYEWEWVMKKTTVSAVRERYVSWDEDSSWYYLYRLESKDESGNVYNSEEFKNAKHGWRTLEEMKKKYDGVIYDLWDKDNAIKQVSDNIHRLELELQNDPWFFKKMSLKQDLKAMKNYLDMANEWPITPYLVCNGHKISVWDSIDVFVNPDKPSQYYFDLDFTKEKHN
jgi:hypothetical protein